MFKKFWNTVGAMCRICLTSPRLSLSAVVMEPRRSTVTPIASRFSARKSRTSLSAPSSDFSALPTSLGVLVSRVVTAARLVLNEASRSLLEYSADTSSCRLRTVLKMSSAWSPSAEIASESLSTVSRAVSPWPRRLSAAELTNSPTEFTPPAVVGCSASVSFSSCLRKSSHSTGTAVRLSGIAAPGLNVGPPEYAGTSWIARAVTSDGDSTAARAAAGIAYFLSTENVTFEPADWGSILSIAPTATPRMRTSSPTNKPLVSAKYAA
ncbi:hypothetical protein PICSAR240_04409 [Mycobacterium avium subsp. paratuberculosis]|nr:hypothetical protein PICSAR118_04313 [Mycobacterium avium subsp. paratuberculosis]CAG6933011.1 hypothetical protein PICSAR119_04317 [Mycobacterium avium subsp. paratuberculosis]CAG6933272.1 hypothetical protein PICSAR120_04291 [Mycobacterium avium subsp. paratuberculosis]CAG6933322.1 hypothetical protein PICSAR11_04288 [Mycobacterium avium subsp. paratuberculosis]CAG6933729.1 hypothetical protein PICSAR113_04361 [Mycobacterium avium subsp. paratuberculosis]